MKLAEHNHNIEWQQPNLDCPRCAQLSLLQQIVDDMIIKREKVCSLWIKGVDQQTINVGVATLTMVIKEYEAIVEGSK